MKNKIKKLIGEMFLDSVNIDKHQVEVNFKATELFIDYSQIKKIEEVTDSRFALISTYGTSGLALVFVRGENNGLV